MKLIKKKRTQIIKYAFVIIMFLSILILTKLTNAIRPSTMIYCCMDIENHGEITEGRVDACKTYDLEDCDKILKNWERTSKAWERQKSFFYSNLEIFLPIIIIAILAIILIIIKIIEKNKKKNKKTNL